MRNKLLSYWLIGFLTFLFVSPIFGWHIHHACIEGSHSFECHSSETRSDKFHGDECQSESLFQHVFEQGATYSTFDSNVIPDWNLFVAADWLIPFQHIISPRIDTDVSYLEWDRDIGIRQEQTDSILLRAPPAFLS